MIRQSNQLMSKNLVRSPRLQSSLAKCLQHFWCCLLAMLFLGGLISQLGASPAFAQPQGAMTGKALEVHQPLQLKPADKIKVAEKTNPDTESRGLKALRDKAEKARRETSRPYNNNVVREVGLWRSLKTWIAIKQAEITRTFTYYLEQFRATNDLTFAIFLIGASLLYGLVHAAGPGHGKLVVSSYVMASNQTLRRGIFLAFLSSMVQATVAVVLVGGLAFLFQATGSTIKAYGFHLTRLSYLLIIALGFYLLLTWLLRRWPALNIFQKAKPKHQHDHNHADHHNHDHGPGEACSSCGHSHIPSASQLEGRWDAARILSLVLSVGLRPCTGALYVLAFALIKGVFWVGALSVYAMGLGTFVTVSLITAMVVAGRSAAIFTTAKSNRTTVLLYDVITLGGALLILGFGILLFTSTLGGMRPF